MIENWNFQEYVGAGVVILIALMVIIDVFVIDLVNLKSRKILYPQDPIDWKGWVGGLIGVAILGVMVVFQDLLTQIRGFLCFGVGLLMLLFMVMAHRSISKEEVERRKRWWADYNARKAQWEEEHPGETWPDPFDNGNG